MVAPSLADISPHFTAATLDAIVRASGGLRHTGWRFGGGFKKGDSYISETFRLHIDGLHADGQTALHLSAVVKSVPANATRRRTFRSADFFGNEILFYRHVLPAFERFQRARGVVAPHAFDEVPRLLYAHLDADRERGEGDFIVLEDLSVDGYGTAPRQQGMDLEHARLVLRTMGRFHALSLAIADREPELLQRLLVEAGAREVYFAERYREWYAAFVEREVRVARDAVRREYGADSPTERRTLAFTDAGFYARMCELSARRNRYSVFGHGDCWMPNFLLQYDRATGRPQTAKMIDFQLARFASPALDIAFCVYACTLQPLREQHYEELLHVYHDSACELLSRLGCDAATVLPWHALLDEMRVAARHGVGMAMEAVPMSVLPDGEVVDLDALRGEVSLADVFKIEPIEDAAGRRRLADVFKHAGDQGYLD